MTRRCDSCPDDGTARRSGKERRRQGLPFQDTPEKTTNSKQRKEMKMSKIWSLIKTGFKAVFCRETVSKVWTILFNAGKSTVGGILSNAEIMDAAFAYAKGLAADEADSAAKKAAFDGLMREYLRQRGVEVGASILNVIRETALAAVNAEAEQAAK